jgi:ribosome biogenesis GTPase
MTLSVLTEETQREGMVIKAQSGFYTVLTDNAGQIVAHVRGRLKKKQLDATIIAVGDRVSWQPLPEGGYVIDKVLPRERSLARMKPLTHGRSSRRWDRQGYLREKEQIIIANPDQVIFVLACANPEPRLRLLDRLLVGAETPGYPHPHLRQQSRSDWLEEAQRRFGFTRKLATACCIPAPKQDIRSKRCATTYKAKRQPSLDFRCREDQLAKRVETELGRRVKTVSEMTGKGRHTTTVSELVPLEVGGWVADTPGSVPWRCLIWSRRKSTLTIPTLHHMCRTAPSRTEAIRLSRDVPCCTRWKRGKSRRHRYESYVRLHQEHRKLADMSWWGIDEEE